MKNTRDIAGYLTLYWVFDPDQTAWAAHQHFDYIEEALRGGVTMLQYRAPGQLLAAQESFLRSLLVICKDYHVPLIVNNEVALACKIDADGVHLGQRDLSVKEARRILGPDKLIGLSISNETELKQADFSCIDYLGIGPVFATKSKTDAAPPIGISMLDILAAQSPCPSVAIGGINLQNLVDIRHCRSHGIAVISALSGSCTPELNARALRSLL